MKSITQNYEDLLKKALERVKINNLNETFQKFEMTGDVDLCQVFRHDFLSKSTVFKFIPISF